MQIRGVFILVPYIHMKANMYNTGWPRSLEIRENRENGQNKVPAGKNQGILKFKKNQGIIREFYNSEEKNVSTGSFSS